MYLIFHLGGYNKKYNSYFQIYFKLLYFTTHYKKLLIIFESFLICCVSIKKLNKIVFVKQEIKQGGPYLIKYVLLIKYYIIYFKHSISLNSFNTNQYIFESKKNILPYSILIKSKVYNFI